MSSPEQQLLGIRTACKGYSEAVTVSEEAPMVLLQLTGRLVQHQRGRRGGEWVQFPLDRIPKGQ